MFTFGIIAKNHDGDGDTAQFAVDVDGSKDGLIAFSVVPPHVIG